MKRKASWYISLILILFHTTACGGDVALSSNKQPPTALRLSGAFIEYTNSMMEFGEHWGNLGYKPAAYPQQWTPYPINWADVLASIRRAGIDTIIIKRLAVTPKGAEDTIYSFYQQTDVRGSKIDAGPTEKILSYADDNGMKVYVGLWEDENFGYKDINEQYLFGPRPAGQPNNRNDAVAHHKQIAADVWPLYRRHRSFAGWYIPQELWNVPARAYTGAKPTTELLNRFLREISSYCKKGVAEKESSADAKTQAAQKQVALSPFFNTAKEDYTTKTTAEITDNYSKILDKSGIDVFMLQDSLAVNGLSEEMPAYIQAFRDAVKAVNDLKSQPAISFWINLENFEGGRPADIERIKKQFCIERRFEPERFVTFDFYQYMNPAVPDCCMKGQPFPVTCPDGAASTVCRDRFGNPIISAAHKDRAKLFEDYMKEFVNKPFAPAAEDCEAITGSGSPPAVENGDRNTRVLDEGE